MKKILIYGDSNTWGDNFITGIRIKDELQWPNILQKKLGNDFKIIQEGLPGRLAGNNEIEKKYKNGKDTFMCIFRSHSPVDYLVIALGTNDLQVKYHKTSEEIISDLLWYKSILIEQFKDVKDRSKYFNNQFPKIIYILPPKFNLNNCDGIFNEKSEIIRKKLNNIKNIINDEVIELEILPLSNDGIHLNEEGHKLLASKVAKYINRKVEDKN